MQGQIESAHEQYRGLYTSAKPPLCNDKDVPATASTDAHADVFSLQAACLMHKIFGPMQEWYDL